MLAHIRVGQLGMLRSRKRTGKGKIMSRDPPIAAVKARNPHFAETKKFCLTSTCSWSATAQDQRSKESAARLYINGQVRIKVEVTLIQKMATNSPLLVDIIRENMSSSELWEVSSVDPSQIIADKTSLSHNMNLRGCIFRALLPTRGLNTHFSPNLARHCQKRNKSQVCIFDPGSFVNCYCCPDLRLNIFK